MSEQHGFFGGRSTVTNLFIYTNFILNAMEEGSEVDAVYTDFKKAFDSVNHERLICKLRFLGICDPLLSWIGSYITGRSQVVKIRGNCSRTASIASGVPQGSHLGPLLFSLFVNDVSEAINHSKFLVFADDIKIFHRIDCIEDSILLQCDLDSFSLWCKRNDMNLACDKCKFIKFSRKKIEISVNYVIDGQILPRVDHITDLGIILDTKLSFTMHYDHIVSKANRLLGFICRITANFQSARALIVLFCALVRPILEYGSILWSPYYSTHINRVERVQQRFLKCLCYRSKVSYSEDMYVINLRYFGLSLLERRRVFFECCFSFKVLNYICNCSEILELFNINVPQVSVRNPMFLRPAYHRTNYGLGSCLGRLVNHLNEVSESVDIVGVSLPVFKSQLRAILL